MMRRSWIGLCFPVLIALVLVVSAIPFARAEEETVAETAAAEVVPDAYGLTISAECAIVVDSASGKVLYEKNAEQRHLIASTTKILTALVVLEKASDLDVSVTIPADWQGVEGSSMYLEPGDVVTIRGLLYGLMLNSGNDAATVLASAVAGDEATFVSWMNDYAARIGMNESHFSNPHGLDAKDHYSTAHDMARLMIRAMQNETFCQIGHTRHIEIDGFDLYFHNKLLNLYEYCVNGKTGYTAAAGRTLVTAAEKDGHQLVAVTLNAPDDWNDQIAMYEYAYARYTPRRLCAAGDCFSTMSLTGAERAVPVYYTKTIDYLVNAGERVDQNIYLNRSLTESLEKGVLVGRVVFCVNGQYAGTSYLISGAYADAAGKEVSANWKNGFKNSCRLAGLYPDAQPSGTYRMDGLLSTAFWHNWG